MIKQFFKQLILPLKSIDQALPQEGTIVDLGCGEGTVAIHLAHSPGRKIIGVDLDPRKISLAKKLSKQFNNLRFVKADILEFKMPKDLAGCVVADVIHHLDYKLHKKFLKKISQAIKPGGKLVIKEIDRHDMIRSRMTRVWDFIFYPQDKIHYLSRAELTQIMKSKGFTTKHQKLRLWVPASVHLYTFTKND